MASKTTNLFHTKNAGEACSLLLDEADIVIERPELPLRKIPWSALQHVYVHRTSQKEAHGYERLILGYTVAKGRATITIDAPPGDAELARAVEAIVRERPGVDLRRLAPRDAYREMGVTHDGQIVRGFAVVLGLCIMASAAPSLLRLARPSWGYVTVSGAHLEGARVVGYEKSSRYSSESRVTDLWVPVVSSAENGSSPCPVASFALHWQTDSATDPRTHVLDASSSFTGGRDILWEAPGDLRSAQQGQFWRPMLGAVEAAGGRVPAKVCKAGELAEEVVSLSPEVTPRADAFRVLARALLGVVAAMLLVVTHRLRSRDDGAAEPRRPSTPYRS